jgi:hypothetical protein
MTPEQRRLRAKIAANARWSHPMARADQADAARTAIFARLERQVDPDSNLSADERAVLIRAAARRLSATLNAARSQKRTQSPRTMIPDFDLPKNCLRWLRESTLMVPE